MSRQKNPEWPHELAGALGSIALSFAHYDFVFSHLVGFVEHLDKSTLYREVLTLPPSEKLKRLRRQISGKNDDVAKLYSNICDRFEELLEDRNRFIHAYWYRVRGEPKSFTFIDIHGRKERLSRETHECTVDDVSLVGSWCAIQVMNLNILRSVRETSEFFAYYTPPEELPIPATLSRKVPFGYRTRDRHGQS